ncbi:MAG: tRNA uridine(34) 5-carboxymethylaminomethyl modification radical SAM/GNAT enzyme Elp3, partial [Coriobacteriia bacterium]|nr:tRNA uridine(34) 5-carboxymethylaminomethyl modification radical SAM/GNAT enzyme Elp3 [Coriobacteriia bacterium]
RRLGMIIHRHNRNVNDTRRHHSKKKLLPYYLKVKETDPRRWTSWDVDQETEKQLFQTLRVKPRRTASGVSTITVITKPWKCSSNCLYCPNDVRMPKSYLSEEPACQRAERNFFDPYLQVASRLRALTEMGHVTDKIELIVLGGTWSDYPSAYQIWFVTELFRALNDDDETELQSKMRHRFYKDRGLTNSKEELEALARDMQLQVNTGSLTYNQAFEQMYENNSIWQNIAQMQSASMEELLKQHSLNETAQHRVVGLTVETRPDLVTSDNLRILRQLGCTKIQIGIQSLDPSILRANNRALDVERIRTTFELLRVFGFKIHAHFMANLYCSSPDEDKLDYQRLVTDMAFLPDEVKLYPCSLVASARLCRLYTDGTWQPYSEEELLDVLVADALATPPYTRISRMVRDISADDILVGNRKTNFRQMVERRIEETGGRLQEIRYREISTHEPDVEEVSLNTLAYETSATHEYFLQWVTPQNRIVGFLRLSLPKPAYVSQYQSVLPVGLEEAMLREVHVYGRVAALNQVGQGVQHLGLGKQLIEAACDIAKAQGYTKLNVISSVGTREYYRSLGFADNGLYQQLALIW